MKEARTSTLVVVLVATTALMLFAAYFMVVKEKPCGNPDCTCDYCICKPDNNLCGCQK